MRVSILAGAVMAALALLLPAWLALGHLPGRGEAPASIGADLADPAFAERVRAALVRDPEMLMAAIAALEARQQVVAASELETIVVARQADLVADPDAPVAGNPKGSTTLVEFFDYNCPYCRRATPILEEAIAADGDLRVVYKEFPILGPGSEEAARIALAVHRQGQYHAFHVALMNHPGPVGRDEALAVAEGLGLDLDRLQEDMEDPAITGAIARNLALAQELRITGTPTWVAGTNIIPGLVDLATLQRAVEAARED